ncbi:MAG: hypothetical protein AABY22_27615 [Nanoarchaeota archaeon]
MEPEVLTTYQGVRIKQPRLEKICGNLYDLISGFSSKEIIFNHLEISLGEVSEKGIKFYVRNNKRIVISGYYIFEQVPRFQKLNLFYLRRGSWERNLL